MTTMTTAMTTTTPARPDELNSLDSYLRHFVPQMVDRLEHTLRPLFDPAHDALSPAVQSLFTDPGLAMRPYAPQAIGVEGILQTLRKHKICWVNGEMGVGKAGRNDAKVLTPSGWKPIGDMRVGDQVVCPDGTSARVTGVFPQGKKPVFRVHFSDGSSTVCCDEHLWLVNTPLRKWRGQPGCVRSLREICDIGLVHANGNFQHFIPLVAPADFKHEHSTIQPIAPYLLGLLLGDGSFSGNTVGFTSADKELVESVRGLLPPLTTMVKKRNSDIDYRFKWSPRRRNGMNPLATALRRLGLLGRMASSKFVPPQYLWTNVENRVALMQGLFDADGTGTGSSGRRGSGRTSNVEYTTVSADLRDAVKFLVQSVGGTVSIKEKKPGYTHKGESRTGQLAYRMCITLPPDIKPFRLSRKANKYDGPTKYGPSRCIVDVVREGDAECTCIKVDHPDQLYVTDDFIVTHNTPIGCFTLHAMQKQLKRPIRALITCPNQLVKKWRRHVQDVLPNARVIIIQSWRDVLKIRDGLTTERKSRFNHGFAERTLRRWKKSSRPLVIIMPRDRGKLGWAWRPAATPRRVLMRSKEIDRVTGEKKIVTTVIHEWHCPRCGGKTADESLDPKRRNVPPSPVKVKEKEQYVSLRPDHFTQGQTEKLRHKRHCDKCGEPLFQPYGGKFVEHNPPVRRGRSERFARHVRLAQGGYTPRMPLPGIAPRRVAPCQLLKLLGLRFDLYASDEVHELKGDGTLNGQMFADCCSIADKIIVLTGTLTGGYAHNLLFLFWRSMPSRLIADGITCDQSGTDQFNRLYGVFEETTTYDGGFHSEESLIAGRAVIKSRRSKALPGISPLLFVNFLLDRAIFFRLQEVTAHLPEFTEEVHRIPLTAEQDEALHEMEEKWASYKAKVRNSKAWSSVRHVLLRWPDKPWMPSFPVRDHMENGRQTVLVTPTLPKKPYPKELKILELVQRNHAAGDKTWIYTELAGLGSAKDARPPWDWMDYLANFLEENGFRVAVLRSDGDGGPKPEDREEWIEKTAPRVDVILSNPTLVQTGLDLLHFPRIIYAFTGDRTYVLRQAARRAWRLGQTRPCRVDYLVYCGTKSKCVQDAAMSLMCNKIESSMAIEGDLSAEGLAGLSDSEDISTQLAKLIDGRISMIEPSTSAMEKYRRRFESLIGPVGSELEIAPPAPRIEPDDEDEDDDHPTPPPPRTPTPRRPSNAAREADQRVVAELFNRLGIDLPPEPPRPASGTPAAASAPETPTSPPERENVQHGSTSPAPASDSGPARARDVEPDLSPSERRVRRTAALASLYPSGKVKRWRNGLVLNGRYVEVVAKRRETVRARDFTALYDAHRDAVIAFVEPEAEAGLRSSDQLVTHAGTRYRVSMIPVNHYLSGERTASFMVLA